MMYSRALELEDVYEHIVKHSSAILFLFQTDQVEVLEEYFQGNVLNAVLL